MYHHRLNRRLSVLFGLLILILLGFSTACNGQLSITSEQAAQLATVIHEEMADLPPMTWPAPGEGDVIASLPTPLITAQPEMVAAAATAVMLPTLPAVTPVSVAPTVVESVMPTPVPAVPQVAPASGQPLPEVASTPVQYALPEQQPLATLPLPVATLPPELGARGENWAVLFTPGTSDQAEVQGQLLVDNLIEYFDAAQTSIHLAVYEMNLTPIAEALIRAHNRGVDVRFVTDDEGGLEADATKEDRGQFAMLQEAGIPVRPDTRSALMHDKFIIIDNEIFITGSTNLTVNDIYENNNNIVAGYVPEVAAIYEREFEEMWNGEFGPKSPSQSGQAVLDAYGQPFVVMFAPEDEPFDTLVRLVSAAESSIRFMAFSFTNDDLGLAILERAQAGVDVKGIFEVRGSETDYAELPRLYCAGIPVRQDGNPQTFHHKVVIVDNYVVITGSMNFSDSAADDNDENIVAISEPEVAHLYTQEFDRRWAEATDPHPEDMKCLERGY
ncbi:MAG: phospholipase D-like domain-containing protein [Chloroflexota bacterium]